MLAVHAETGLTGARELAGEFAHRLAQPVGPNPDALLGDSLPSTGFDWGETGVGWALLRFAEVEGLTPSGRGHAAAEGSAPGVGGGGLGPGVGGSSEPGPRSGGAGLGPGAGGSGGCGLGAGDAGARAGGLDFAALGRAALARDPGPDVSVAERNRDYSWCSGLAGRLLGRAADHPIAADDPWLGLFADRPVLRDMSLCHGELGVLNTLLALGGLPAAMAERGAAFLLGALERFGPSCALARRRFRSWVADGAGRDRLRSAPARHAGAGAVGVAVRTTGLSRETSHHE